VGSTLVAMSSFTNNGDGTVTFTAAGVTVSNFAYGETPPNVNHIQVIEVTATGTKYIVLRKSDNSVMRMLTLDTLPVGITNQSGNMLIAPGYDVVTLGSNAYVVYITEAGAITLLKAEEFGKTLEFELAQSSYLTDVYLQDTTDLEMVADLEHRITHDDNVWPELAANTYIAHQSTITTPTMTYDAPKPVDADTMTITITEMNGNATTNSVDVPLKRKTITLSGTVQDVWVLDHTVNRAIVSGGMNYELIILPVAVPGHPAGTPILIPMRTIIMKALAGLVLDINQYWDKGSKTLTQTRYPKENDLIWIPGVVEYRERLIARMDETHRFSPALYETLGHRTQDFRIAGYEPIWGSAFISRG
jgi:hypothetical protein